MDRPKSERKSKKRRRESSEHGRKSVSFAPPSTSSRADDMTTVVGGSDAVSTAGSRTTLTLSSGKWAVVKPSSGAVTQAHSGKRLVLLQLPHGTDLSSLEGCKLTLPASGTGSMLPPASKRPCPTPLQVAVAPLPPSHNTRLLVTPSKRGEFAPGTRLLAPPLAASIVLSLPEPAPVPSQGAPQVGTAIGSLRPAAVPVLGRLAPVAQVPSMPGLFTPPGSSGAGVPSDPVGPPPAAVGGPGAAPAKSPKRAKKSKKAGSTKKSKKSKK